MRARGFSLVEFMIAMTIGLFLVGGLVYLIAETSRSRAEIERSSRQIENGRYALDRIAEDLRHAGYFGEYYSVAETGGPQGFPASLSAALPCAETTIADLEKGYALAIQGYDGGASVPTDLSTCLASADYQPGTDILVVRRASTSTICPVGKTCPTVVPPTPVGALVANQMYIQTNAVDAPILGVGPSTVIFTRTLPAADSTALPEKDAPLRRYLVRIYFVSRCNVPATGNPDDPCDGVTDDGGTPIPTLKMMELGVKADGNTGFRKVALAEGIEQLQFDYGIDTTADGVADDFRMCDSSTTPCPAVADWRNIVAVQVNLVARNAERSPGYVDDKTYSLGLKGYTAATNDGYRRHAYTSLVRLKNIAMRLESE